MHCQFDLTLANSPGVVTPCMAIKEDPSTGPDIFGKDEAWMKASEQAGIRFAVTAYNCSSEDRACVYILYWNLATDQFFTCIL